MKLDDPKRHERLLEVSIPATSTAAACENHRRHRGGCRRSSAAHGGRLSHRGYGGRSSIPFRWLGRHRFGSVPQFRLSAVHRKDRG